MRTLAILNWNIVVEYLQKRGIPLEVSFLDPVNSDSIVSLQASIELIHSPDI